MPLIRIVLAGSPPSPAGILALQRTTTELMESLLGKRRDLTVVTVATLPAAHWSAGGQPLPGHGRCAHLEAFITAGTNTAQEKAAFLGAAQAMLADSLGDADAPIYLMVHELPASDWGYDGLSQAARLALAGQGGF